MAKKEVKNTKVKQIFETMEYGSVMENYDLAVAWLKQQNNSFSTFEKASKSAKILNLHTKENLEIKVSNSNKEDIDKVIQLSEEQFKKWTMLNSVQKAKLLNRLAVEIERHTTLICQLEMIIRNILTKDTKSKSLPLITDYFRYYAGWATMADTQFPNYEPYGICGYILDDETPLFLLGTVIAPAFAMGNVILLVPSPKLTPIAFLFQKLCENIGFSAGALQIITGVSNEETLLKHKNVNNWTYIGNLCNKKFMDLTIREDIYLTTLHLGTAPMIVFDNADMDSASDSVIEAVWSYYGMLPWSINKLYIQETIYEEFTNKLLLKIKKLNVGFSAYDKTLDVVISKTTKTQDENTKLFNNLPIKIGHKSFGSNILSNEQNAEVLTILPFRTANEAVALANNTRFGLAASVWTENISLANEVSTKLQAGILWVNSHGYLSASSSFSPYKESGRGYFGGKQGLLEYMKNKICNEISDTDKWEATKTEIESHLPGPQTESRTDLFYGGAFKKSESGLTNGEFEYPNRKDVENCVELAKKGCDIWRKLPPKTRAQHLWKLADNIGSVKSNTNSTLYNIFAEYLYNWATLSNSVESLVQEGQPQSQIKKEPLGIIVIELQNDSNYVCIKLIIAALACGNSVIIVNRSKNKCNFLLEICKILPSTSITPGTLSVILKPNEDVINSLINHRQIASYFKVLQANNVIKVSTLKHVRNLRCVNVDTEGILRLVTKNKNVYTSVGESFL